MTSIEIEKRSKKTSVHLVSQVSNSLKNFGRCIIHPFVLNLGLTKGGSQSGNSG